MKNKVTKIEEYKLKDAEIEKLSESFVSQDEEYIASLGNGYIMNYLVNKSVKSGFAFITNKHAYFKGSCLNSAGQKFVVTNEERTVDIKNITGSGFSYHRQPSYLLRLVCMTLLVVLYYFFLPRLFEDSLFSIDGGKYAFYGAIFFVWLVGAIICIKNYLLKRKTLFYIEYAGGRIAFDVSFYAKAEIDDFQKQLRRTKDFAEEETSLKTVLAESALDAATRHNVPAELRQYAELLKDGMITQEEYDAMKKKLLEV